MKISENGLKLIKQFEGCKLTAYRDSVGVWTIGWGTTNADKSITGIEIRQGVIISQAQADKWLEESVNKKYAPLVEKYNGKYNFNQNQFDALVSFAYNIGSIDQLTARGTRSIQEISNHIPAYNKAGGKELLGLTRRRNAEKILFDSPYIETPKYNNGDYVEISVPFYYTGSQEGEKYLYDNTTELKWISKETVSLIKDDNLTARALYVFDKGELSAVQVFNDQFLIKDENIVKKL